MNSNDSIRSNIRITQMIFSVQQSLSPHKGYPAGSIPKNLPLLLNFSINTNFIFLRFRHIITVLMQIRVHHWCTIENRTRTNHTFEGYLVVVPSFIILTFLWWLSFHHLWLTPIISILHQYLFGMFPFVSNWLYKESFTWLNRLVLIIFVLVFDLSSNEGQ